MIWEIAVTGVGLEMWLGPPVWMFWVTFRSCRQLIRLNQGGVL